MKLLFGAILALAIGTAAARAETIDMATVKCADILAMSESETTFMFTWMLGYAGGQAGTTTIDLTALEAAGKDIGEYCGANPDVGVLSAAQEALN
jgi:acid stress chaperone HdeB